MENPLGALAIWFPLQHSIFSIFQHWEQMQEKPPAWGWNLLHLVAWWTLSTSSLQEMGSSPEERVHILQHRGWRWLCSGQWDEVDNGQTQRKREGQGRLQRSVLHMHCLCWKWTFLLLSSYSSFLFSCSCFSLRYSDNSKQVVKEVVQRAKTKGKKAFLFYLPIKIRVFSEEKK